MTTKKSINQQKIILFVDRGNIARSTIAELVAKKILSERSLLDQYAVTSVRTQGIAPDDNEPQVYRNLTYYPTQYIQSKNWLDLHGIDLTHRWSTGINSWFAEKAAVIFAMDKKTRASLSVLFPEYEGKMHFFSEITGDDKEVDDPQFMDGEQALAKIYDEIEGTIVAGLPRLLSFADGTNSNEMNRECREEISHGKERF